MRANADAATATVIFASKTNVSTEVSKLASSQLGSCVQKGMITPFSEWKVIGGRKMAWIDVCRGNFGMKLSERMFQDML